MPFGIALPRASARKACTLTSRGARRGWAGPGSVVRGGACRATVGGAARRRGGPWRRVPRAWGGVRVQREGRGWQRRACQAEFDRLQAGKQAPLLFVEHAVERQS